LRFAAVIYYEHHLGDYLRDTAHLTLIEEGVYRRLLDQYYIREAPLPPDLRGCYKFARAATKQERAAVEHVLADFFELQSDGYHQRRADDVIARYRSKSGKARAAARSRWSKSGSNADALDDPEPDVDAGEMQTHVSEHANASADTDADAMRTGMRMPCGSHAIQDPRSNLQDPNTKIQDPDSQASPARVGARASPPDPIGTFRSRPPIGVPIEDMRGIRDDYPPGTYPESEWGAAERMVGQILGDGMSIAELRGRVRAFHAQQFACGNVGTQFIPKPSKFFAGDPGPWRGPFPLPAAKQPQRIESARDRIRRAASAGEAESVIEGEVIRG
jgi:uncharacterized protein YdaU (DUF1376 family)